MKILAFLHLFLFKFSFHVSDSLSPKPKADLISAKGEAYTANIRDLSYYLMVKSLSSNPSDFLGINLFQFLN